MRMKMTVSAASALLKDAEKHIQLGQVPVLRDGTKAKIIQLAEQYETQQYGKVVSTLGDPKSPVVVERKLFD